MTVASYLISFLMEKNVKTVFAYPGANVLKLYGMLCKSGIKVILTRHEQGAIHAACGYAKSTGKTGVCIATSGPGATNLITGIADAYLDSAPVLVITGQVPSRYIGRDAFQEADIMGITLPITKHNYLVRSCQDIPRTIEEAWRIAKTPRQGPVLVDITSDLFDKELHSSSLSFECLLPRARENSFTFEAAEGKIKKALAASFRPLILAGGGVVSASASKLLAKFSAGTGIPVAFTMMGKGVAYPYDDSAEYYLGMAGVHGRAAANRALSQCDLLIAIGCRFSDRTITDFEQFGRSRTIIHADIDPAEIQKNISSDISVVSDANSFICEMIKIKLHQNNKDIINAWRNSILQSKEKDLSAAPFDNDENAEDKEVYSAIAEYIKANPASSLVCDVGTSQTKAARLVDTTSERGFVTSGGLGAMGFGLPAAIGAAYAFSDTKKLNEMSRIILICGDGGFQMTMQEMDLIAACPAYIKIIIINNRSLKMVKDMEIGDGGYYDLQKTPDFTMLARAYGISAESASLSDNLYNRTREFLYTPESALLEIKI